MNYQSREVYPITRLAMPFNCIRFLILTDGTVYENALYELDAYKLDEDEIEALINRATTLMCNNKFYMKKV